MQCSSRPHQFSWKTGDEVGINRVKDISYIHGWAAVSLQTRQTSHSSSLLTCEMQSSTGNGSARESHAKCSPCTQVVWHGRVTLPWHRGKDRRLPAGESEAGAFYQRAMSCAWHFTAAVKELVLGGGARSVPVPLLADRSCDICSLLCSLMSVCSFPNPSSDKGNDSCPPFGKRDKPDCGKSKERRSQSKELGASYEGIW